MGAVQEDGRCLFSPNISGFTLRVDSSGRRVASLDVDGVIKVHQRRTLTSHVFEVTPADRDPIKLPFPPGLSFPQVWSLPNPLIQTKATIMSKSPLLSLEWATKPDRLV